MSVLTLFHRIFFLLISLLLVKCASFGGGVLYRTTEKIEVKTIGYINLYQDSILNGYFINTGKIFRNTIESTFKEYGLDSIRFVNAKIDYNNPDTNIIRSICKKYKLDGLILSNLHFTQTNHTMYYVIPLGQEWNTQVFLKLFSKGGTLLIKAGHDTKRGNSYAKFPTPDMTVRDGTRGASKQVCKSMGLKKKPQP